MSDEFTPEEIELFSKLDEDEIKKVERYKRWADQKASETAKGKLQSSSGRDLTLTELRQMMADAPTRSILKSLMAEAEQLGLTPPSPPKSPSGKDAKKGRLI